MKILSSAQMKSMEQAGAKVTVKKPMKKAAPRVEARSDAQLIEATNKQATAQERQADSMGRQADAIGDMASSLGQGQAMLANQLRMMTQENESKTKLTPYRFTIQRNRKGLIETIDAHPIMDDGE